MNKYEKGQKVISFFPSVILLSLLSVSAVLRHHSTSSAQVPGIHHLRPVVRRRDHGALSLVVLHHRSTREREGLLGSCETWSRSQG